jgi:hypothetical protein
MKLPPAIFREKEDPRLLRFCMRRYAAVVVLEPELGKCDLLDEGVDLLANVLCKRGSQARVQDRRR